MTPRETNILLTQAALLDSRMRRDPEERAAMAMAWAEVLADVPLGAGLRALTAYYRDETRSVMPADIIALLDDAPEPPADPEYAEARSWLTAHGVDPDEFSRRIGEGESPSRLLRELGVAS